MNSSAASPSHKVPSASKAANGTLSSDEVPLTNRLSDRRTCPTAHGKYGAQRTQPKATMSTDARNPQIHSHDQTTHQASLTSRAALYGCNARCLYRTSFKKRREVTNLCQHITSSVGKLLTCCLSLSPRRRSGGASTAADRLKNVQLSHCTSAAVVTLL